MLLFHGLLKKISIYNIIKMDSATNFANSKKRAIRVSKKGVFYSMSGDKKVYGVKAAFKKTNAGGLRKLTAKNVIPKVIRPKALEERKKRSNAGVARGPREATLYRMIFRTPKAKAPKAMIASPGGTVYKSKSALTRRMKVKALKNMENANPFATLAKLSKKL
jgi:hypothetical protein